MPKGLRDEADRDARLAEAPVRLKGGNGDGAYHLGTLGDADGDGYGNPADSTTATSQPAGYVANAGDCNDANGSANPDETTV